MLPGRMLVLSVICFSTAAAQYQAFVDLLECQDESCGDACDKTWLKFTPTSPTEPTTTPTTPTPATTDPSTTTTTEQMTTTRTTAATTQPPATPSTTKGGCPFPAYQVRIIEGASSKQVAHYFTPENQQEELDQMKRSSDKYVSFVRDPDATACIIQHDKLDVFADTCNDWKACTVPVCKRKTEAGGRNRYIHQLVALKSLDEKCGEMTHIGYAMNRYNCCGANGPMFELVINRVTTLRPDFFYTANEGERFKWSTAYNDRAKSYTTADVPFFVWTVNGFKQTVCPRPHQAPLVRAYCGDSNVLNHYYFMMNDLGHFRGVPTSQRYRVELTWHTGCAVRKDQVADFKETCPEFMDCMRPLCNNPWKDAISGTQVYRLQMGDIHNVENPCPGIIHVGYVAAKEGCCGATQLMYTLIRNKSNQRIPGYFHPVTAQEVQQVTASAWSVESADMWVWPTQ